MGLGLVSNKKVHSYLAGLTFGDLFLHGIRAMMQHLSG